MTPEELREQLLAAAHRTPPPEIDTDRVRSRVRRRRSVRYTALAGAGLAVAAAAVLNTLPSTSPPETRTPTGSVHRQPTATGGTPPGGNQTGVPPLPHYTCGTRIPASSGRGTVTVRISGVRKAPDGAPRVSYAATATAPSELSGAPRILVLKEGRVVAGQDPAGPPANRPTGEENTARRTTVAPDRPQHVRLAPVPGRPCAGTTWSAMWKGGYEVAVVLATQRAAPPGTWAPDALVVARAPLVG
ncbi:hypothetical protein [Streptomyces bugieae]|uniref:Tat pathway signal sequence domain protein n=1 Tax=Streptomyces bugieae TaxID=3098223 RepID=A0ABU7NP70_9ACTN|nr:hypothetical protein [Streptomyces sp. DSM 41528]